MKVFMLYVISLWSIKCSKYQYQIHLLYALTCKIFSKIKNETKKIQIMFSFYLCLTVVDPAGDGWCCDGWWCYSDDGDLWPELNIILPNVIFPSLSIFFIYDMMVSSVSLNQRKQGTQAQTQGVLKFSGERCWIRLLWRLEQVGWQRTTKMKKLCRVNSTKVARLRN